MEEKMRAMLAQKQKDTVDRHFGEQSVGSFAGNAQSLGVGYAETPAARPTLADVADRLFMIEARLEELDRTLNGGDATKQGLHGEATSAPEGIVANAWAAVARLHAAEERILSTIYRIESAIVSVSHV